MSLGAWVRAACSRDVSITWAHLEHRVGGEAVLDAMLDDVLGTEVSHEQEASIIVGHALAQACACGFE